LKTLTIIDTFGFLFRSYYALPPLRSSEGFPTGLLTGFMKFILNIGKDFESDYLVFALDSKGDTFRNEIYPQYKAQRPPAPEDLLSQLPLAIEWIEKMGFKTLSRSGFEADDIIASLANYAKNNNILVRVVSHDKDLYQLIEDEKIFLFDPIKKHVINEEKCFEKYGVKPEQFIDYQALVGDSADNVPGVRGVGAKTAQSLISEFDNLDNIYENLENIAKPRWTKLLTESKELAFLSKKLVSLRQDIKISNSFDEFILPSENPISKISEELKKYGLNFVLQRISTTSAKSSQTQNITQKTPSIEAELLDNLEDNLTFESILLDSDEKLFEVLRKLESPCKIAFDTETNSLDVKTAKIVGFSFCLDEQKAYYVPLNHKYLGVQSQVSMEGAKRALKVLNMFSLIAHNFKFDYAVIEKNFGIKLNIFSDTIILAWLLNSSQKLALDFLIKKYFQHNMISFKDTVKKGEDFSSVDIEQACLYASEDAFATYKLYFTLMNEFKLKSCKELLDEAREVEFEFISVLAKMEKEGIKLDDSILEQLKEENAKYLLTLSEKIHSSTGREFNINSPKQLSEILFDVLKLTSPTKKKSTNEMVLKKLYKEHEIIPLLLDYREAFKLQSTYIEPLLNLAKNDKMSRIFTSFVQTGTQTGRLSSKNPNLQNIPVRSEAGKNIRKAFIASEGKVLLGLDYSQIELRLLAHFSKDSALLEAFRGNLDIHLQTASKIFGEEKAQEKRSVAKSINFGLLYGMGSKKLGDTLGISSKEAKVYIENYFTSFPTVKNYLKSIEDDSLKDGYVKTLLKRRRYFDYANVNAMFKAAYLREAVNTLFQGSAADLIKLAMNKIHKKYEENQKVRLLLQIHDELILEVDEEIVNEIGLEIKDIMENIYTLEVPLKVSLSIAKNWQELK